EERRNLAQMFRRCDSEMVTHVPDIARWLVLRREPSVRLGPAHRSRYFNRVQYPRLAARMRIELVRRHETAVDHHDTTVWQASRCEHPIAGPRNVRPQRRSC